MLRRHALILTLASIVLAPAAGRAQAAGEVVLVPDTFGLADCTSTNKVLVSWTSAIGSVTTGDFYRIMVSNASGCAATSGTIVTGQLGGDLAASATLNDSYNLATAGQVLAQAGITSATCQTTGATTYICVNQCAAGSTSTCTVRGTSTGTVVNEVLAPPVPVVTAVASGDGALYVSWTPGTATSNTILATSYDISATRPGASAPDVTTNFPEIGTGPYTERLGKLVNNQPYDVTIKAVSAGRNRSTISNSMSGTPLPVNGFWEIYKNPPYNGRDPGGCGGGPAGLFSLLGVALGLKLARRRS